MAITFDLDAAVVGRDGCRVAQDHPRTLFLSVLAEGRSLIEQRDVASMLTIGDIVMYSSTSRYRATFDRVAKHTFMIAYEALALPDRLVESRLARRIDMANPLGHVVTTYLSRLATDAVHLPAPDRAALERPTIDRVREQRLIGAATDLSSAAFGADRISTVSRRWGLSDHANFTRAFRRHFAASPSEFRRRALGPTPTD